jgi:hypothetical protein
MVATANGIFVPVSRYMYVFTQSDELNWQLLKNGTTASILGGGANVWWFQQLSTPPCISTNVIQVQLSRGLVKGATTQTTIFKAQQI